MNEYPKSSKKDPPKLTEQITSIRFSLHFNSALIEIKSKAFDDALKSVTNTTEIAGVADPEKAKAYYRRALANIGLKDDKQGLKDLEETQKLASSDAVIVQELGLTKKKLPTKLKRRKRRTRSFSIDFEGLCGSMLSQRHRRLDSRYEQVQ